MAAARSRLRRWADSFTRQLTTLAIAYRDSRTPLAARATIAAVLAYALSPLDLIPDAIPVIGLLDDLVLLPLGIALSLRLLPPEVLRDARSAADDVSLRDLAASLGRRGLLAVVALWLLLLAGLTLWWLRLRPR